ncbi:hypothetical protein [Mesorhizobium sp. M0027]|uniref:IS66 family insertion sequence element accessory protein TnpB n=1 Tax=Mesorhizobium sp. M0027 TaxID=2956848 RepID=UPI003339CB7B
MVLASKWLESRRFTWPPIRDGQVRRDARGFAVLVAGLDWTRVAKKHVKRPVRAT